MKLCAGAAANGMDWWTSDITAEREAAKLICDRCHEAPSCLRGALERGERWGVWAGLDLGVVELADPVAWSLPEVAEPVHGSRSAYVGGCHCPECTHANTVWIADWRTRRAWSSPVEHAPMPEQLDLFGEKSPVTASDWVTA